MPINLLGLMLKKLPYQFNNDETGNIGKLLGVISPEMQQINDTLKNIKSSQDIDVAEGHTLDRIGVNVDQSRGSFNDLEYRSLLKAKIKQSLSKGDIDTIIEVAATVFDVDFSDITLEEVYPAKINIKVAKSDVTENLQNAISIIYNFIKKTLAAGIDLTITLLTIPSEHSEAVDWSETLVYIQYDSVFPSETLYPSDTFYPS
jgi:hypothetical protein